MALRLCLERILPPRKDRPVSFALPKIEFDLPEAFLPEFPPAMFLQNRPELGDVSRGEVVSINNYYRLFKDILTAVQLDGLRLLLIVLARLKILSSRMAKQ